MSLDGMTSLDELLPPNNVHNESENWFTIEHDFDRNYYTPSISKSLPKAIEILKDRKRMEGEIGQKYMRIVYNKTGVSRSSYKFDSPAKCASWILTIFGEHEESNNLQEIYKSKKNVKKNDNDPTPFAFVREFSSDPSKLHIIAGNNICNSNDVRASNCIILILYKESNKINGHYISNENWCLAVMVGNNEYIILEDSVSRISLTDYYIVAGISFHTDEKGIVGVLQARNTEDFNIDDLREFDIPSEDKLTDLFSDNSTLPIVTFEKSGNIVGYSDLNGDTYSNEDRACYDKISFYKIPNENLETSKQIKNTERDELDKIYDAVAKEFQALMKKNSPIQKILTASKIKKNKLTDIDIMNLATNRLYGKSANSLQEDFAKSNFFDPNCQSRVLIVDAPPGSGKTACIAFTALKSMLNNNDSSILIATSLQQVSANIARSIGLLAFEKDKYIKVRRVDGGIQMDINSTLLWAPRCFTDHIFNFNNFINNFLPGDDDASIKLANFIADTYKKHFPQSVEQFSDSTMSIIINNFSKKIIPRIFEGFSDTGSSIARATVGTFEGSSAALIKTLSNTNFMINVQNKLEYIIIDEWDTILRDAHDTKEYSKKRFSSMYGMIAVALAYMKCNQKCKLILLSASGGPLYSYQGPNKNMVGLFDPIADIGPMQVLFNSNPWGSQKLYAIPKQFIKKFSSTVLSLVNIVSKYTNIDDSFTNDIRMKTLVTQFPQGSISILLITLLLKCDTIETFIRELSNCEATTTIFYMLSQIIAYLTGHGSYQSHMIAIFVQGVKDQIWHLALLGILIYKLVQEGFDLPQSKLLQSENLSMNFLKECVMTTINVVPNLDNRLNKMITKGNERPSNVSQFIKGCGKFIKEELAKLNPLNISYDVLDPLHYRLPYYAIIAVMYGVVIINKEMTSDALITNFLGNRKLHPICIITTSKLGEGVDIPTIGPTFVLPTNRSSSPKDTAQWLGRGFRSDGKSCCLPIVDPNIDNDQYWYQNPQDLIINHRSSYESFLSSEIAHRIVTCNGFDAIFRNLKSHSDADVGFLLPKPLSFLRVNYKSPVYLNSYVSIFDQNSLNIENIIDSLNNNEITSRLILGNQISKHSLNKMEENAVSDAIIGNLYDMMQRGWPALVVSFFIPIIQKLNISDLEDISLANLAFEIGDKLAQFMDTDTYNDYMLNFSVRNERVFTDNGMSKPVLNNVDTHQYLIKTCVNWIGSGLNAVVALFIIGAASVGLKTNVYNVDEKERESDSYIKCRECIKAVMFALDKLSTLGLKMRVVPDDGVTRCNNAILINAQGPFDVILRNKEFMLKYDKSERTAKIRQKFRNESPEIQIVDTFYVLAKRIFGESSDFVSNDVLLINAIKSGVTTGANNLLEPIAAGASLVLSLSHMKGDMCAALSNSLSPFVRTLFETANSIKNSKIMKISEFSLKEKEKVKSIRKEIYDMIFMN